MINRLFTFGQGSALRHMEKTISKINKAGKEINGEDCDFILETNKLKDQVGAGASLDSVLPKAFALCRAASEKYMGMRHYDVQLMGGISLHKGSIAEMNTGEGKTLVASLPAFLNSLAGQQVHIVTVNDYLAKRDADIMRPLFEGLGLTVGALQSNLRGQERLDVYANDIIYATSSELAFDYLRDNMAVSREEVLQKHLSFAIVDEVDSILIDEARTPLIISGQGDLEVNIPSLMDALLPHFSVHWWDDKKDKDDNIKEDIVLDEKNQNARLMESGFIKLEEKLKEIGVISAEAELYHSEYSFLVSRFTTAARAQYVFKHHVDYLASEGQIKIINQSTGRLEEGRRWSDGLHQAIEIKEKVEVKPDNQTLGTVSLQNFFRMYDKLSGMSGTAYSEFEEFGEVYGMGVVRIPTHKPSLRKDEKDMVYLTEIAKIKAILEDIREKQASGRPVLVGTASVQESDRISRELDILGLPHQVLNAKQHGREAHIISQAGRPGTVTIATNMAGRGTDILLGGSLKDWIADLGDAADESAIKTLTAHWKASHQQVIAAGGLHVVGTTRNDSRRIDDQLVGRAGRQGDPGSSKFYVSLEDKLMRLFGGAKYQNFFRSMGMEENEGIEHNMLNKAIKKSQSQIEGQHSSVRKELLKYDDIVNMQRKSIYSMRSDWLFSDENWLNVEGIIITGLDIIMDNHIPKGHFIETWNIEGLEDILRNQWNIDIPLSEILADESFNEENIHDEIINRVKIEIENWETKLPDEVRNEIATGLMLHNIDSNWREHLTTLDQLREGIHLRGYAQKNPLQEYGKDALSFFESMITSTQMEFIAGSFHAFPDVINQNLNVINHVPESSDIEPKDEFVHIPVSDEVYV